MRTKLLKVCVFCGKIPDSKTKEHVIPKWLIKLTGDPKRQAYFGYDRSTEDEAKPIKFSFDRFTFPACESCNNNYSHLEGESQIILGKILEDEQISARDLSRFLDWLDKVRVGLWLGLTQLEKNPAGIKPQFHISQRIGQFDRILLVEKSNYTKKILTFYGVNTLPFAIMPSAFVMNVNNYFFTNISFGSLFSRRLGFPHLANTAFVPDSHNTMAIPHEGTGRIMLPLIRRTISEKGPRFFQPMFKGGLITGEQNGYNSDYVRTHSMDHSEGIGNIFEEKKSLSLKEYEKGDKISLVPTVIQDQSIISIESAINTVQWQNWIMDNLIPDYSLFEKEGRTVRNQQMRLVRESNDVLIKYLVSKRTKIYKL